MKSISYDLFNKIMIIILLIIIVIQVLDIICGVGVCYYLSPIFWIILAFDFGVLLSKKGVIE